MIVRKTMAVLSLGRRSVNRLLIVFSDWFGTDKVQMSILFAGSLLIGLGVLCEVFATEDTDKGKKYFWLKVFSVVLVSVGTSIAATGMIFRIAQQKDKYQQSLQKAGVLFVGDRNALDEVIGWDNWIRETHRCAELIIIGKDQAKWAEESAAALGTVLSRDIQVTFIFQGKECEQRLEKFWNQLTKQDMSGKFVEWRQKDRLKLCKNSDPDVDFGYYWNGKKLIVKIYFKVPEKREAPFIVFDVSFASGKFDDADFSVTCLDHVPSAEKKKMLVQAGMNICRIVKASELVPLA